MTNQEKRLKELESYQIVDSLPEEDYNNLTILASEICQTPLAYISFIAKNKQFYKSFYGTDITETTLEDSICGKTYNLPEEVVIVPDLSVDARFRDNPFVKNDPKIVFYAGVPLVNSGGYPLGTLCVLDMKTQELSPGQLKSLKTLARQTMILLELRRKNIELTKKHRKLNIFKSLSSEIILETTKNINSLSKMIRMTDSKFDDRAEIIIDLIKESTHELEDIIKKYKN